MYEEKNPEGDVGRVTDYVYVIKCDAGPIKVGMSDKPQKRLVDLQVACPFELELTHIADCKGHASEIESAAHHFLSANHLRGEWFSVSVDVAVAAVQRAIDGVAPDVKLFRQLRHDAAKAQILQKREERRRDAEEQVERFRQIRMEQSIHRRKTRWEAKGRRVKTKDSLPAYLR